MQNVLEMHKITKSFNGIQVLFDAELEVKPGEVQVLIGENGAGKSTIIKILSGAYRKEGGEILLEGKPYEIKNPKEAIDKGISVIYQEFNLVPYLSIYENIFLGKEFGKGFNVDHKKTIEEARKYMKIIGLDEDPQTLVSKLSVAQKQMVEIAKAISNKVKVLVLDEPTAAITDKETSRLFEIIRNLKSQGIGIIYISHRMNELFEIGDRVTIMRDGHFISTLDISESSVEQLTELMVGRKVDLSRVNNTNVNFEYKMLDVQNLNYKGLLKNISFDVKKGEIFGFSGLVGSGRTEVAKCIIGAFKRDSGKIFMHNGKTELKDNSIEDSIHKGIVYLSEDRKDEGLILTSSISDNIALPNLDKFGKVSLNDKEIKKSGKGFAKKLRIRCTSTMQNARELSGGNQQKVVIAKWLCRDPDIYIFDEPTRGIDVGARSEIYEIMMEIVSKGKSIIMISSDLPEVLKMCNRIGVMCEGELVKILDNSNELTQKDVLSYALSSGGENVGN